MSVEPARRGFLRGLVTLPLIGGGVKLIGKPTGVAEPVTRDLLTQYWNWLFFERRLLCRELATSDADYRRLQDTHGGSMYAFGEPPEPRVYYPEFHFPLYGDWKAVPHPSTRAALVMSAIGFDWRPFPVTTGGADV